MSDIRQATTLSANAGTELSQFLFTPLSQVRGHSLPVNTSERASSGPLVARVSKSKRWPFSRAFTALVIACLVTVGGVFAASRVALASGPTSISSAQDPSRD